MVEINAPGAIRTHGPRIRNPVLYPPELRGHTKRYLRDSVLPPAEHFAGCYLSTSQSQQKRNTINGETYSTRGLLG